jgi:hypothetical protein
MTMTLPADPLAFDLGEDEPAGDDLAALDYSRYPYIPREWLWENYIPVATPVIVAAKGGTGKGLLFAAAVARVVLGLPFPGEDQELRREPKRVVWISGQGEDDPFEDLAPRLRAAIARAVAEFGLDPELAGEQGAIRLVHDLSEWPDGDPVEIPRHCGRIRAELDKLNALGGPRVGMVVADSLSALLSDGYTIDSRQGARRVMVLFSRFARKADVAFVILHHMTKDGKVAGSRAVLDALRLVLRVDKDEDTGIRTLSQEKGNATDGTPVSYVIAGTGPTVHAQFTEAADARAERVAHAQERGAPPEDGSLRARMAAVPADPGPFHLWRRVDRAGEAGTLEPVGEPALTREDARTAAVREAGRVLSWGRVPSAPGSEMAVFTGADGSKTGYLVMPSRKTDQSGSESS